MQVSTKVSSKLDRSVSMQNFLKELKIISELSKSVQSMKSYIYPTALQKQAMEPIKNKKQKNVIVKYQEFNGIKLTVFLPLLNNQMRHAITESVISEGSPLIHTAVICHSKARSAVITEFLNDLSSFCSDMVKIINLDDSSDIKDSLAIYRNAIQAKTQGLSFIFVSTAGSYLQLRSKVPDNTCYSIVLDKMDLLQAYKFTPELKQIANELDIAATPLQGKVIMTTSSQPYATVDGQAEFDEIKKAYVGSNKALVIQIKEEEDESQKTQFEQIAHLHSFCKTTLDKYILVFSLLKLAIIEGKTLIVVDDITEAYRMKFFLQKFNITSFVLAPDMPKNQIGSILHFFHIGQFSILIALHTGYASRPQVKELTNVINFDMPSNYNGYKENGQIVNDEQGCILSLPKVDKKDDMDMLQLLQRKFHKNFGHNMTLKCVPVMWQEITKVKSRVEAIVNYLTPKTVKKQKLIEFQKQLVSNKSLKSYFKENPQEKEILENSIQKSLSKKDKNLFRSLDVLPDYVVPDSILAVTPEQISMCTMGSQNISSAFGNQNGLRLEKSFGGTQLNEIVEPENQASIIYARIQVLLGKHLCEKSFH